MNWSLLGASGTPTIGQVDAKSAVSATLQDGYAPGQYQSFTIGTDGTVTATYSNGQKENVGQLALASVTNLQGLQMLAMATYATTLASGTASITTSGTAGLGTLQDGRSRRLKRKHLSRVLQPDHRSSAPSSNFESSHNL